MIGGKSFRPLVLKTNSKLIEDQRPIPDGHRPFGEINDKRAVKAQKKSVKINAKLSKERNRAKMSDFIIWDGNLQEYNGTEKNLVIPNRIDGDVVTSIGVGAFRNKGLRSVVIPDTVRAIYDDAFSMNHLSTVTIPNSVEEIFDHAFENNQLTQVILSKNIITLGLGAFAGNRLSQVSIPLQVMQRGIEMQFQLMQAFDAGVQLEGRDAD